MNGIICYNSKNNINAVSIIIFYYFISSLFAHSWALRKQLFMSKQNHSTPFAQGVLAPPQLKRNFIQWLYSWNRWQTKLYLDDLSTAAGQLQCRTEDLVELLDYFVFIEHSSLQNINLDMYFHFSKYHHHSNGLRHKLENKKFAYNLLIFSISVNLFEMSLF